MRCFVLALIAAASFSGKVLKGTEKIQRKAGSRLLIRLSCKNFLPASPNFPLFHYFCTSDVKKLWQSKKMFSRK